MADEHPESDRCEHIGEAMPDIAGVGILVGFAGQALISLVLAVLALFWGKKGLLRITGARGTYAWEIQVKRVEYVSEIILVGNDIQMTLGIAYLINIFSRVADMDLYHLRLVYDIASFVGLSNAMTLVCWTACRDRLYAADPDRFPRRRGSKDSKAHDDGDDDNNEGDKTGTPRTPGAERHFLDLPGPLARFLHFIRLRGRYRVTWIYAIMFLALAIHLGVRLAEWAPDADPGRCYEAAYRVAAPGAAHPAVDRAYVGVTAAALLAVLLGAVFAAARFGHSLLAAALLQFPVHFYFMVALRAANIARLDGPETEDGWDFGQTTAVVLLGVALFEAAGKCRQYFKFEHRLRRQLKVEGRAAASSAGGQPDSDRQMEEGVVKADTNADEPGDTRTPQQ